MFSKHTVHSCSSSVQPLSETPGFCSALFKAPLPMSALIGQQAHQPPLSLYLDLFGGVETSRQALSVTL